MRILLLLHQQQLILTPDTRQRPFCRFRKPVAGRDLRRPCARKSFNHHVATVSVGATRARHSVERHGIPWGTEKSDSGVRAIVGPRPADRMAPSGGAVITARSAGR